MPHPGKTEAGEGKPAAPSMRYGSLEVFMLPFFHLLRDLTLLHGGLHLEDFSPHHGVRYSVFGPMRCHPVPDSLSAFGDGGGSLQRMVRPRVICLQPE
ncbi:MAG: hypothetical protein M2R45_02624 [Verrucomicrobia subdivision 3 bacterium]|nr:hypothetical protein [Limisphaerales bacterium]MCS1416408.1 hypothetical protein [Limisphaerales bacterium]